MSDQKESLTIRSDKSNEKKPNFKTATDATATASGMVCMYTSHEAAENAVKKMQRDGFDLKKLSIVGRDYQTEENVVGYYNMGDRTKYWGKLGAFWGGLWGLLFGSAVFVLPGFGPLVIAGAFVSTLVGAIEGALIVGGVSALGAALYSLGVPKDSIVTYETEIKAGQFMMIAHGSDADLKKAREIAQNAGAQHLTNFVKAPQIEKVSEIKH